MDVKRNTVVGRPKENITQMAQLPASTTNLMLSGYASASKFKTQNKKPISYTNNSQVNLSKR